MQRIPLCFCILLFVQICFAQFTDNFTDGDFTNNPTWVGDVANFQITNGELQLNAPDGGFSSLFTEINLLDSAIWEIYTRLDFDPSGSNQLRIYLQLDNQDVMAANGYFIELGESGSEDKLAFYRLDAGNEELIAEGTIGAVASAPEFRLRITREANGDWLVESDYSGGSDFSTEVQFSDATYLATTGWFGLTCKYSTTRTDKFFFDDISARTIMPDVEAPLLVSATPIDETTLTVQFSEKVEMASAENVLNYNVSLGIGNPVSATLIDVNQVELVFANPFVSGENHILSTENIRDEAGNISTVQTTNFIFTKIETAEPYDLLITEIMSDPTPAIGLPEAEWIEIFNKSNKTIELEGMIFEDGGGEQILPAISLLPNEYAIICDDSEVANFEAFGKVVEVEKFPALTNGGELLSIKNMFGEIIHAVDYSSNWYMDSGKKEGGWTLELINPQTPCLGAENWIASNNLNGGTPGRENSVLQNIPDETFPDLLAAFPESNVEVLLTFSEGLDFSKAAEVSNYSIDPALTITSAEPLPPLYKQVKLRFAQPIENGTVYKIKVENEVSDCAGNTIGMKNESDFALPTDIEPGDLVINEILFNPQTGGFDFLEVYNLSGKILDLSQLLIGRVTSNNTQVFGVENPYLLFPGTIAAFTADREDILSRYNVPNPAALIETQLPTMPDDEGNVKLYITGPINPIIVDDLNYARNWHHPLLKVEEGVSLERIDPSAETDNANNWQSAAASVGFATPTGMNSQFKNSNTAEGVVTLEPSSFSPNDDGVDDFLQINYSLEQSGYLANVTIFDAAGRPVKALSQNELLGTTGFLRWDGDTDDASYAKTGIYIVYIQIFAADGIVQEFKEPCVLSRQIK